MIEQYGNLPLKNHPDKWLPLKWLVLIVVIVTTLTYFQLWPYVFVAAICGLGLLFGGYGGHPER